MEGQTYSHDKVKTPILKVPLLKETNNLVGMIFTTHFTSIYQLVIELLAQTCTLAYDMLCLSLLATQENVD